MNFVNVTAAPKTTTFQMRINPEVKRRVEDIYASQGLRPKLCAGCWMRFSKDGIRQKKRDGFPKGKPIDYLG